MQTKKTALVTGANKGIGYALVRELIAQGYEVWIGARNRDLGLNAARELKAHYLELDVTRSESVANALVEFKKTQDSLDVLVNNAGVYLMGKDDVASLSPLGAIRETFEVNLFGAVSVTQAFLPVLKKSKNAQVLNISSGMGSQGLMSDPESLIAEFPMMFAYCSSKAALNTFTILLAKDLRASGIRVNSICPGYVDTDLNGHSGVLTPEQSAKNIVPFIMNSSETGKFAQENGQHPW